MKPSWSLVAMVLLGCAGQQPPPSPQVDVVERCGEVLDLAEALFPTDRYSFIAEHCVVPMVREPACREAVVRSLGIDASTRNDLVARACTRAYCPRIRAPKPELCTRDFEDLSPAEMQPLGLELFAHVRRVELGAAEAKRWDEVVGSPEPRAPSVAAAPLPQEVEPPPPPKKVETKPAKKNEPKPAKVVEPPPPPSKVVAPPPPKRVEPPPPKVVEPPPKKVEPPPKKVEPPPKKVEPPPAKVVEPPPPPPPPPKVVAPPPPKKVETKPAKSVAPAPVKPSPVPAAGGVRLRLTVRNRLLSVAIGGQSWDISEEPASSEFDPPAERAVQLGARTERVIVEMGKGVQYNHLVGVLNALKRQYVRDISLSSIKE